MSRVKAYCGECKEMIDITDMPFISYSEETPIVLDIQLNGTPTERKAINFVKRSGIWEFSDHNDGSETLYHYPKAGDISHYEPEDETHKLDITGGYWSPE